MNDEQAIRNTVALWLSATRSHDLEAVLDLMADDVVFMVPGREPFGKKEFAASFESMNNISIESRSDIQELTISGSWAWMRNRLEVIITPPQGNPARRSGYTLTILRKESDGKWVIARDANLLSP